MGLGSREVKMGLEMPLVLSAQAMVVGVGVSSWVKGKSGLTLVVVVVVRSLAHEERVHRACGLPVFTLVIRPTVSQVSSEAKTTN